MRSKSLEQRTMPENNEMVLLCLFSPSASPGVVTVPVIHRVAVGVTTETKYRKIISSIYQMDWSRFKCNWNGSVSNIHEIIKRIGSVSNIHE